MELPLPTMTIMIVKCGQGQLSTFAAYNIAWNVQEKGLPPHLKGR